MPLPTLPRLQYPVTRNYSLTFTICTFIGFALIAGVLGAINFASDGYQTLTVISSDFNSTQTFWYDRIVPSWLLPAAATNARCQPWTYHVGDTFRTTNKIFNWQVTDAMNQADDSENLLPGNIHSALPYSNVPLDVCDIVNVMLDADLSLRTVSARVEMLCQMPIPLVASTVVTSSQLATRVFLTNTPWLTTYNGTFNYAPQFNVSMAVIMLGWDVLDAMLAMYEMTGGTAPTMLATKFDFGITTGYCPPAFVGQKHWCTEAENEALPVFEVDGGDYIGYDNFTLQLQSSGNLSGYMISAPQYWYPIHNFLHAVHAAARADLGTFRPSNMFQNLSMLPFALNTTGFVLFDGKPVEVPLSAAAILANGLGPNGTFSALPMPAANLTLIDTTYVCNRQFLKSVPALFFAITSGTLSNVLLLWGIWMLICSRWVKASNMGMNSCEYHVIERGLLPTPQSAKTVRLGKFGRSSEDWTYSRASTDEGPSSGKSPGPFDDDSGIGHHYPPPPSWMLQLPRGPYEEGEQSYSSVQLEDMGPGSSRTGHEKST